MNKKSGFFLYAILIVAASFAQSSKSLVPARPEDAGMSTERLTRIDKTIEEYVKNQKVPGAVAFIARNGKIVLHRAYGSYNVDGTLLKKDDIFRIASQTKAITSVAVMMLYEEGKLLLDDPISKYIPEFAKPSVLTSFNEKDSSYTSEPAKSEITIRHLLTHTSGIDYPAIGSKELKAVYAKAIVPSGLGSNVSALADKIKILAKLPLKHNPGEKFTYGLNTDVLGYLVELRSGMSLDNFLRKRIFDPIGMNDTYFILPKEKFKRLVDLYTVKDGNLAVTKNIVISNETTDYPIKGSNYFSGGAGLSSTIEDYAKFLQMLLNGGAYNNVQLLGRKTVELMITNQLSDKITENFQFSLGFSVETSKNDFMQPSSIGSFSWGGAFSTSYWADPKEKVVALLYMQMIPNSQRELADKFKVLTYQAIID